MRRREVSPEVVRELRGVRSREVIAHALRGRGHGTDAKSIWRYETGKSQPSARILPDYAEVLGAESVEELYGEGASDDDEEDSSMPTHAEMLEALRPLAKVLHSLGVEA